MTAEPTRRQRGNEGSVTLDACVSLILFMSLALFMMSLFPLYMIHHATAHALMQAVDSLALDTYAASRVDVEEWEDAELVVGDLTNKFYSSWDVANETYTTMDDWYERRVSETENADGTTTEVREGILAWRARIAEAVKKRFMYYLMGDEYTDIEKSTDVMLRRYRVIDGWPGGMTFTGRIYDEVDGSTMLFVTVDYRISNEFKMLNLFAFPAPVHQEACARLWYRGE